MAYSVRSSARAKSLGSSEFIRRGFATQHSIVLEPLGRAPMRLYVVAFGSEAIRWLFGL